MSKIVMEATELRNATVERISLVERGAIRAPFKIIKSEKGQNIMHISLTNIGHALFGVKKQEPQEEAPKVVAVVAKKGTDIADLTAQLEAAEFKVVKTEEQDGATILVLDDTANLEEAIVLKGQNDLGVLCTVKKSFSSWSEGTDFMENMKIEGFYPGIYNASNVFVDTIYNIMRDTPAGNSPVEAIKKACKGLESYVVGLASEIPSKAFKMEELVLKEEVPATETAASEAAATETTTETVAKSEESGEGSEEVPPAAAADTTGEAAAGDPPPDTAGTITDPPADLQSASESAAPTATEQLEAMIAATKESVQSMLSDFMASFTVTQTALVAKVDEAVAASQEALSLAKKSEEAINGTVIGSDQVHDKSAVRKKEEPKGIFDTAIKFEGYEPEDRA